ncbi:MAG TPA: enoyl-[acyl-carrier-protein] reductase FabL [candidate division Zixibacteria bacterium]|nr:enoyl-[acyl-carrier-protein] reductase FabL [candidate division Zixibacteria bacterium]
MSDFSGKVALVTGSGRGIGRTIAIRLAQEGADIVVNYFRNREPAEKTAQEIMELGRRAIVVKANVGELDQLDHLYAATEDEFGKLDILVHNAASGYLRPALEQKPRGWEWTMNINARSLLFGAQHAARLMKGNGGAIVAISSLGSARAFPDYVVVGASKAALESLVRYLGVELSPLGITVNAISPGIVETDALQHFSIFAQEGQKILDMALDRTPVGRLCTPDDVADLVLFLSSPKASMICGQTIVIDGGYTLYVRS